MRKTVHVCDLQDCAGGNHRTTTWWQMGRMPHAVYSDSTTRVMDSRGFNGGRRDSARAILAEHDVSGESGIEAAKDIQRLRLGRGFWP